MPSCADVFHRLIWFSCTPYLLASSVTVASSRIAAKATFGLNAALCFLRVFAISIPLLYPLGFPSF
jgi:hypothetical protein